MCVLLLTSVAFLCSFRRQLPEPTITVIISVVKEAFRSSLDVRVRARAACEAGYENPEPKLLARIPSNRRPFLRSR